MREPSREAREALCKALAPLYAEHRGVPDQINLWGFGSSALCGCSEGDLIHLWPEGREALARALDDFAEKRVKLHEFDVGTYHKIIAYIAFVLTGDEESPAQDAADAIVAERDALRARVEELEAADEDFVSIVGRTQEIANKARGERDDWKARAEAAEAALDEIIDMDAYEIHEGSVDPQAVAREARRARGEG